MIKIVIPGREPELELNYLLLDINGTLTVDGDLITGVEERLAILKEQLAIYLLSADTFGKAELNAGRLGLELLRVNQERGGDDKLEFLQKLDSRRTGAVGNGYNDVPMLEAAALSIAVLGPEGCSREALMKADIVVNHINDALDLLLKPQRLVATLRA